MKKLISIIAFVVITSNIYSQTLIWSNDFQTPARDSEWSGIATSSSQNYWQINQGQGGIYNGTKCYQWFYMPPAVNQCIVNVNVQEEALPTRCLHIGIDLTEWLDRTATQLYQNLYVFGPNGNDLTATLNTNINTIGYKDVYVTFRSRVADGTNTFAYSTNNGGSWSTAINIASGAWSTKTITATTLANNLDKKTQVRFRFRWQAESNDPPLAIDDIQVWGTPIVNCTAPTLALTSTPTSPVASGTNITLNANPTGGNNCTGTWQYNWSDGTNTSTSQNPTFNNITSNRTYTATVYCSTTPGCSNTATYVVNIAACTPPTLNPTSTPTSPVASGTNITLNANPTGGNNCTGTWLYSWSDGTNTSTQQNPTFNNITSDITYTATVYCSTNATCKSTATIPIRVAIPFCTAPDIIISENSRTTRCPGEAAIITLSATNQTTGSGCTGGNWLYKWTDGTTIKDGQTNISYNNAGGLGVFTCTVYCSGTPACYKTATFVSTVRPVILASVTGDASTCQYSNSILTLTKNIGDIVKWKYSINGGTEWIDVANSKDQLSITADTKNVGPTQYRAELKDGTCPSIFTTGYSLEVKASPNLDNATDQTIYIGNKAIILTTNPSYNYTVTDDKGLTITNYTVTPSSLGQYKYDINARNTTTGCISTKQITINVIEEPQEPKVLYNLFTPNNDGINEVWETGILWNKYKKHLVQIFNRSGKLIFETTDYPNNKWNGKDKNGTRVPDATYYYIMEIDDYKVSGDLTIVR